MGLQIIGTKKCRETQKTERFFKERGWSYHFVDLDQRALSVGELNSIARAVGTDELVNTNSKLYKKKGMSYMDFNPLEEIEEHPELMKTPVVRNGSKAVIGFEPELWNALI